MVSGYGGLSGWIGDWDLELDVGDGDRWLECRFDIRAISRQLWECWKVVGTAGSQDERDGCGMLITRITTSNPMRRSWSTTRE